MYNSSVIYLCRRWLRLAALKRKKTKEAVTTDSLQTFWHVFFPFPLGISPFLQPKITEEISGRGWVRNTGLQLNWPTDTQIG
jgi:hypothetical protein